MCWSLDSIFLTIWSEYKREYIRFQKTAAGLSGHALILREADWTRRQHLQVSQLSLCVDRNPLSANILNFLIKYLDSMLIFTNLEHLIVTI